AGAPRRSAEAHSHYDQALSLWERVPDAERLAGESRACLAFRSAVMAADSGDNHRAITQLRALPPTCEVSERLAYYLSEMDDQEGAIAAAEQAVATAADEASLARALATHARTLTWSPRHAEGQGLALRALDVARAAGARDAEVGALLILAIHAELQGDTPKAHDLVTVASAEGTGDLAMDLRARFHHARLHYEQGDLAHAAEVADEGIRLAFETGLKWSTYGTDLRFLRFLIHYVAGEWDQAEVVAASFGARVGTVPEATLSSFALFLEVARGLPAVESRLGWLRPFWSDGLVAYMSRGLAAEYALWQGDPQTALTHVRATLDVLQAGESGVVRIAAVGLWALGDLGIVEDADEMADLARFALTSGPVGQRGPLGPEGRAWGLRVEAEWHRVHGRLDPELWRAVVEAFDYGFVYETARARWRLAEALLAAGDREAAQTEWALAQETATTLRAAPLERALADFGRRARFTAAAGAGSAAHESPNGGLTARELEVLALVAEGLTNREIAERLFIAQKTVSVHVSNILGKLDASTRTQAAATARAHGLLT
ncbi:LuxR C-terminal-related transcriptional regulator, partial [Nonomuraea sp. NPDC050405]|uniref:LuxR C-terminal-related transcriptional regulator n=1 Tax=Nonomuraea sp. NPDC050405 TaxID=3154509 RepID=UPI003404BCC0